MFFLAFLDPIKEEGWLPKKHTTNQKSCYGLTKKYTLSESCYELLDDKDLLRTILFEM